MFLNEKPDREKNSQEMRNINCTNFEKLFNGTFGTGHFPDKLKSSDMTPVLRKITFKTIRLLVSYL